jgi:hypothetical protein
MTNKILELFSDKVLVRKVQTKLSKLFQLAELESSRAGKVGMEVGSVREKILIALLIYKFGENNVETEIPITESEIDVKVFGNPISIKTVTSKNFGNVKLVWTVDAEQALLFSQRYQPTCDMILAQINWGNEGGLYYFPKIIQIEVLNDMGRENYIKLPKAGTNPRGVEMTANALRNLAAHEKTLKIPIKWSKETIEFKTYQRWLEMWKEG